MCQKRLTATDTGFWEERTV